MCCRSTAGKKLLLVADKETRIWNVENGDININLIQTIFRSVLKACLE